MNKSLTIGIFAGLTVVGGLALLPMMVGAESAMNGCGNGGGCYGIEMKAEILNMDTEQLQDRLQESTMLEVAEDQGFTQEQFQAEVRTAAQERWVEKGLSDEEIQARLEAQEQRQADCYGSGLGQQQGGMRFGKQ